MPKITPSVNQTSYEMHVEPAQTLLCVLRDQLDLTGTKYGCGEGQCSACTVLIEGAAVVRTDGVGLLSRHPEPSDDDHRSAR